jgi:glycosyltransferase involved in cell wall biosynthesis
VKKQILPKSTSVIHALHGFASASHSEGFGQAVIEAIAVGKPVIASRIAPSPKSSSMATQPC